MKSILIIFLLSSHHASAKLPSVPTSAVSAAIQASNKTGEHAAKTHSERAASNSKPKKAAGPVSITPKTYRQLDSDNWKEREAATEKLIEAGQGKSRRELAMSLFGPKGLQHPSLEVRRRAKRILEKMGVGDYYSTYRNGHLNESQISQQIKETKDYQAVLQLKDPNFLKDLIRYQTTGKGSSSKLEERANKILGRRVVSIHTDKVFFRNVATYVDKKGFTRRLDMMTDLQPQNSNLPPAIQKKVQEITPPGSDGTIASHPWYILTKATVMLPKPGDPLPPQIYSPLLDGKIAGSVISIRDRDTGNQLIQKAFPGGDHERYLKKVMKSQ